MYELVRLYLTVTMTEWAGNFRVAAMPRIPFSDACAMPCSLREHKETPSIEAGSPWAKHKTACTYTFDDLCRLRPENLQQRNAISILT